VAAEKGEQEGPMHQLTNAASVSPWKPLSSTRGLSYWLTLSLASLVLLGIFWTRETWVPAFVWGREPTQIEFYNVRFSLSGRWIPIHLSNSRIGLFTLVPLGRLRSAFKSVSLVIVKYHEANQIVNGVAQSGVPTPRGFTIDIGKTKYDKLAPVFLGEHRGVLLLGSDEKVYVVRLDLPVEQVALIFSADKDVGSLWLEQRVHKVLPSLVSPNRTASDRTE
jgi:hypothetical protein